MRPLTLPGAKALLPALLVLAAAVIAIPGEGKAQTQHGDTVMFDRPPTIGELEALFGDRHRPNRRSLTRTRKPVLGGGPAPTPNNRANTFGGQSASTAPPPRETMQGPTGKKLGFNLRFKNASAEILQGHVPYLDKVGALLTRNQEIQMTIVGHADATGDAHYNLRLSERRAQSIRNYLIQAWQIDGRQIMAQGHGETRPLPGLSPYDPKNRRVEFVRR